MKANPHNYDAWFDYLRLLESDGDVDQVREVYERAIANVPPSKVSSASDMTNSRKAGNKWKCWFLHTPITNCIMCVMQSCQVFEDKHLGSSL